MLLVSQVSGALWLVLAAWRVHVDSCHGNDRWQGREEADNSSHLVAAAALGRPANATCLRTMHCAHGLSIRFRFLIFEYPRPAVGITDAVQLYSCSKTKASVLLFLATFL